MTNQTQDKTTKLDPMDAIVNACMVYFGTEECTKLMAEGWRPTEDYKQDDLAILVYQKYLH